VVLVDKPAEDVEALNPFNGVARAGHAGGHVGTGMSRPRPRCGRA
jgi:hypothetical protein